MFKNAVSFKKEKVCPQIESNQGTKNMCDIASGVTYSAIQILSLFSVNAFFCEIYLKYSKAGWYVKKENDYSIKAHLF